MQIDVIATVNEAKSDDFAGKTVLVIDALRATSNMVTGLVYGAKGIVPVETVQQAFSLQEGRDLLGGERSCRKIPGFDLGNSPFEYMDSAVRGRRIVMTTTNGTRALQKAHKSLHLLACSFLNARACANAALELGRDVAVLCAGTHDVFSLEDGLCAGLLIEEILAAEEARGGELPGVTDFARAMHGAYSQCRGDLAGALLTCANGKRLSKLGFYEDILYCAGVNRYELVPAAAEGVLVPLCLRASVVKNR